MPTAAALAGADASAVAAARTAFAAFLQERFPTLSLRAGPLADLVLGPAADALAAVDARAAAAVAALDPEAALAAGGYDAAVLDAALAGRGVTRLAAATAAGSAAFRFSAATTRTVPAGFVVRTVDGVEYAVSAATRFLAPGGTAVLDTDVVLTADPAGGYTAAAPVAAVEPGLTGNRPAGTGLVAVSAADGLTAVWAATDLTGGADAETDAALLARLPAATAPRTAASAAGAEAVVRAVVPELSAAAAVGFGDAQMRRGRSVLSAQTPGRFDLWYRTAAAPGRERVRVTATYQGLDGPYGVWQFSLAAAAAPGRFRVEKVIPTEAAVTAAGYAPTQVTPGYDLSATAAPPDVRTAADAAQSAYATAVVRFTDPDTATAGLTAGVDTKEYDAVCRTVPGIAAAQTAVEAAGVRAAGGDCLVRAAVPVLVAVTAVATPAAAVTVTADEVAAAVAAAVNAAAVGNRLSSARVAARAVAALPAGVTLALSAWSGIVYPADDGTTIAAAATADGLEAAADYDRNVGPSTVAFYCDVDAVTASVD